MKKLMLWMLVFGGFGGILQAQDIAGTWQGTLQPPGAPRGLRLVMQISKENDQLKAVLNSIDQGGQAINAGAVTFQSSVLKLTIPAIGGNYEGRLSGDGKTITGTFNQGAPLPLTFDRATPQTVWAIPEPPPPPKPMADNANLAFDVATIKPANPATPGKSILVGRGGSNLFTTTNSTLSELISFSYSIHPKQIVGGPSWIESELYDISAKPEQPGIPNTTQLRTMVQKLLAERFGLAFHIEKRETSAFVLSVGKNGSKMTKSETGGILPGIGGRGPGGLNVVNATMGDFSGFLQGRMLDRPVVDQTGLKDRFNFTLEFKPDLSQLPPGAAPPQLPPEIENRPDLFTAIREQLGLQLESTKAPVEMYVIDKVQKPSEN
jgi:uncharacterized protein (TIGR03435 family)